MDSFAQRSTPGVLVIGLVNVGSWLGSGMHDQNVSLTPRKTGSEAEASAEALPHHRGRRSKAATASPLAEGGTSVLS